MKDQFVSYELSVKLKELGFNERCIASWLDKSYNINSSSELLFIDERFANSQDQIYCGQRILCLAPLWQEAFDWFRKEYDLNKLIDYRTVNGNKEYYYIIIRNIFIRDDNSSHNNIYFKTYEKAEEACLLKLIELCKNN